MNFTGAVTPQKVGPTTSSGNALYQYLGCYQDNTNIRIEATDTPISIPTQTACARTSLMLLELCLPVRSTCKSVGWVTSYQIPVFSYLTRSAITNALGTTHKYAVGMAASCLSTTTRVDTFPPTAQFSAHQEKVQHLYLEWDRTTIWDAVSVSISVTVLRINKSRFG